VKFRTLTFRRYRTLFMRRPVAAPAGPERRHVAVLFADISGFTRLVESTDPEAVYSTVRPLMDDLVCHVHRYGGRVQQVLGDGFMAVFGLTGSRGDEAERAVCAGLAAVATGSGADPPVHAGVEYGEVLVTSPWETAGFGVWGRPVTRAKRLCDLAGPGQLQVGPGAYALAGRRLDAATPVLARLRGVADDVTAHQVAVRA
jgi:class 3 adenylate cyclase